VAGTAALARCLSSLSGSSDGSTDDPTEESSPESTDATNAPDETTDGQSSPTDTPPEQLNAPPASAFAVGEDDPDSDPKPHHVWMWNATDETRRIELVLTAGTLGGTETTLLSESVERASGEAVAVALCEGSYYELSAASVTERRWRRRCAWSTRDSTAAIRRRTWQSPTTASRRGR
jgi:hypothetical protein